jgi:copper transport protein
MYFTPKRSRDRRRGVLRCALWCACLAAALPAGLAAHVVLEAAAPAPGAVIAEAPSQLRLRYSGMIEPAYTRVELRAPDGGDVALGALTFVAGSDREFTLALPPLTLRGTYTVQWRTAGADGHVLTGSYTFELAGDTAVVETAPDTVPAAVAPSPMAGHHVHEDVAAGAGLGDVLGRWLHFAALTLLLGALTFRLALLPRVGGGEAARLDLGRRTWRLLAIGALLLVVAAVLRLWLQSAALHGADRAWSGPLLSMMLRDTSWGRAWLLQAFLLAVLAAGLLRARPGRDLVALLIVAPAALGLAVIPALTGHAAGMPRLTYLVVANDALHVIAAGAWIGTLAVLLLAALPALRRHEDEPDRAVARAIDRFSPLALAAAALLVASGALNAILHVGSLAQLTGTDYGRALLVKLGLFAAVLLAGFINWRVVRPALRRRPERRLLRASAGLELGFAVLVLLATAVLTGLPRP